MTFIPILVLCETDKGKRRKKKELVRERGTEREREREKERKKETYVIKEKFILYTEGSA
jgi:hypothetical protein